MNAQIAQLTELLAMEKSGKVSLEETIAGLRASIASAEGERDRFKGLYEGLGMNPGDFSGALTNTHLRSSNSGNV